MQKNLGYAIVIIAVLFIGGWWYTHEAPAEPSPYTLELVNGDMVTSWAFKGAYTGDAGLIKRAQDEIARLKTLFGTKKAADYELYVSIANQYDLMGDGQNELLYLRKALAIDSTTTGLAWYNMGVLFARLGALHTARFAYEQAAKAQGIPQYQGAVVDFLKTYPDISN